MSKRTEAATEVIHGPEPDFVRGLFDVPGLAKKGS